MAAKAKKAYIGIGMEGGIAKWYTKTTRKDLAEFERLAAELAKQLRPNSRVLEIAPGPGYLSVALAKLGNFKITGLDISETFVRIASEYAKQEGATVRFVHGSASDIPFEDGMFDLIMCRAAFKNFSQPLAALNEMHRVLKPGGRAMILDLCKDAPWQEIENYVKQSGRSPFDAWLTKFTFKHLLLRRAYTEAQMNALAVASDFRHYGIFREGLGMEVTFIRRQPLAELAA